MQIAHFKLGVIDFTVLVSHTLSVILFSVSNIPRLESVAPIDFRYPFSWCLNIQAGEYTITLRLVQKPFSTMGPFTIN